MCQSKTSYYAPPTRPEGPRRCLERGNAGLLKKFSLQVITGNFMLLHVTKGYCRVLQTTTCYYMLLEAILV